MLWFAISFSLSFYACHLKELHYHYPKAILVSLFKVVMQSSIGNAMFYFIIQFKMQIGLHFHFQLQHALYHSIFKLKCNSEVCNFIFRKQIWVEVYIAIMDCIIIIMEGFLCLYSKWQCNV